MDLKNFKNIVLEFDRLMTDPFVQENFPSSSLTEIGFAFYEWMTEIEKQSSIPFDNGMNAGHPDDVAQIKSKIISLLVG